MRYKHLDFLKVMACFTIYCTHFISAYHEEYFIYWKTMPTSLILHGVTGKFGVVIFGVILGYLSYSQGIKKNKSITEYSIKRYLYFFVCGLIINTIYKLTFLAGITDRTVRWKNVIISSLKIGSKVFPTFWCMQAFLIASIVCFALGRHEANWSEILITIGIFLFFRNVWIVVCLLGPLAFWINSKDLKIFHNVWIRSLVWILGFFLIKRHSGFLNYLIDGIVICGILIVSHYGSNFKKFCNNPISNLGEICMSIFIIHPLTYKLTGPILFKLFAFLPYKVNFLLSMLVCFGIIVLVSYPLNWVIKQTNRMISDCLSRLYARFSTMFSQQSI